MWSASISVSLCIARAGKYSRETLNPRDFLTTAAIGLVLVVGGLAIADSVRGCNEKDVEATPVRTTAPTTTAANGPTPQADAPEGWPEGELDGVLTFVDADTCVVRSIGLAADASGR